MFSFYSLLLIVLLLWARFEASPHSLQAARLTGIGIRLDIPAFESESGEMQEKL
jgi:hypothetical protein